MAKMVQDVRLQVALAQLGFCSRRGAIGLVKAGRVKLNGAVSLQPGQRVNLARDIITVDGRRSCVQKKVYFVLNKPKGVTTTVRDRYASRCAVDLVKQKDLRIYPVGRLDKDTTGLLLLTNDGELAYRLTHPKFGIQRVYQVYVKGEITREKLERLQAGILLEGIKTRPCKLKLIAGKKETSQLEIELTEGRKRQIKKMFWAVGHPVMAIERIAFGPLSLGSLQPGQWRPLNAREITQLYNAVERNGI